MPSANADLPPWLDYSGQSPADLLACFTTHRHDSLLAAFATALQYKQDKLGKKSLSNEEQVVLAITALEGEVNNGGYDQFFVNSSHEFAPTIVSALRRVGCEKTAAITQRAIAALGVPRPSAKAVREAMAKRSTRLTQILERCDQEFYALVGEAYEIETKLMAFVVEHQARFAFADGYVVPEPSSGTGYSAITEIETHLLFARDKSTEGLMALARPVAGFRLARPIAPRPPSLSCLPRRSLKPRTTRRNASQTAVPFQKSTSRRWRSGNAPVCGWNSR